VVVLVREHPVEGVLLGLLPLADEARLLEQLEACAPRLPRRDGRLEEDPDVVVSRARALEVGGELLDVADGEEPLRLLEGALAVEIEGEEPAGVVGEQRVDPEDLLPAQVLVDERDLREGLVVPPLRAGRGAVALRLPAAEPAMPFFAFSQRRA
jgi:hypothetical protein